MVDYGMGNLRSVQKGLQKVGVQARVVSDPDSVLRAPAVVLPGVGAFRDCMRNLQRLELLEAVLQSIQAGKPYLGICLGLQILFEASEEFGLTRGLGVLKGKVVRFPQSPGLKVPHMGWNQIRIRRRPPILKDIPDGAYFYFVHSYYVVPQEPQVVATTTEYGVQFVSMVWRDNVFATQFHPEKSQALGLRVLRAFGELVQ